MGRCYSIPAERDLLRRKWPMPAMRPGLQVGFDRRLAFQQDERARCAQHPCPYYKTWPFLLGKSPLCRDVEHYIRAPQYAASTRPASKDVKAKFRTSSRLPSGNLTKGRVRRMHHKRCAASVSSSISINRVDQVLRAILFRADRQEESQTHIRPCHGSNARETGLVAAASSSSRH